MTNQAIVRRTVTYSVSFTETPSEATKETLEQKGFIFAWRNRQHFRKRDTCIIVPAESLDEHVPA
jgi:hypothetical protein